MISNRVIIYLTVLVLLGMGVLFFLNINNILTGRHSPETYISLNDVSGVGVKHKGLIYTLNFNQQNDLLNMLNQSIQMKTIEGGTRKSPSIEQIIIYRFEGKPPLILTPITYLDNNLVYSNQEWNPKGYLKEVSLGRFDKLLAETYDE